ncbi:uncharacterized protein LOC130420317 [Triplophysa dalaica]|uniref:uncharacterized protein LOC130420317 n=1 Tax=Triplophysa dalaica TaxID=1582913 RepID=UPI0024DF798E|nr:uncharacterized protein LOC130420317 [Triplophysa dalaica]
MSIRSSTNRISGFTPFELLTGRSFPGPSTPLTESACGPISHCVYFEKLNALVKQFSHQAPEDPLPEPIAEPSQYVCLKRFRRKWNEARWSPPLRVVERTTHCVRLSGKGDKWYHLSSCVNCDSSNRSLSDTAVDLRAQVQEREDSSDTPPQSNQQILQKREVQYREGVDELPQDITTGALQIRHKKGDLFSSPPGEPLAHCVSQDRAYGAGIAVAFKNRYGVEHVRQQNKSVGECAVTHEDDGRTIFHLITKVRSTDLPTYENFTKSLIHMRNWCETHIVKSVSIPRLGCGLDGLDFQRVSHIITEVFAGTDMTITIYML